MSNGFHGFIIYSLTFVICTSILFDHIMLYEVTQLVLVHRAVSNAKRGIPYIASYYT